MKLFRKALTANTEEVFEINGQFATILNVGPGDMYVNFDKEATTNSLLIPAGMGRSFYFGRYVKNVHVISDGTSTVQIDDMR
ncbi:hypothetical protein P9265_21150 [Schinkia azotoformans]|uniref:hypothetical protein n=1 Tax=Schinkia azotoformans TaxID=1454 RepID=UPI002E1E40C9|nr:hypothetical protein [Schinkia azotoformans]